MQVYEKIGLMRKFKSWSQEDMADRLGMSVNGYAKIERGETDLTLSRLQQISELLEASLLDLLNANANIHITSCWSYKGHFQPLSVNVQAPNDTRILQQEINHLKQLLEQKERKIECLRELLTVYRKPAE